MGKRVKKKIRKEPKWCFGRCKRLLHTLVVFYEIEPSYYEPIIEWQCSRCGKDKTLFPGTFYE